MLRTTTVRRSAIRRSALAVLAGAVLIGASACSAGGGETDASAAGTQQSAAPEETRSSAAKAPATSSPAQKSPAAKSPAAAAPAAGAYVTYDSFTANRAATAGTDVVLFFNASWCPTCRAAVKAIESDGVPDGLTIVSVDYDSARDLRREYGVTVQHTFVQVDEDGSALAKWTGSRTPAEIQSKTV